MSTNFFFEAKNLAFKGTAKDLIFEANDITGWPRDQGYGINGSNSVSVHLICASFVLGL